VRERCTMAKTERQTAPARQRCRALSFETKTWKAAVRGGRIRQIYSAPSRS
jgi:hypothetical protein